MKKVCFTALFLCLFFVFFGIQKAYAANICWDGGGSTTNWSEDANWAGNIEPGTGDIAVFDNGTCSGTPNKNAIIDTAINIQGINIIAYSGTISQGSGNIINIGSGGYTQSSTTSTFTGNDADIYITNGGDFSLSNGTFTNTSAVMELIDDFTFSGGTYNHNSGTLYHEAITDASATVTGSVTFYNYEVGEWEAQSAVITVASGTTITVEGLLLLNAEAAPGADQLNGPGTINVTGNIQAQFDGWVGNIAITLSGTGNQTITSVNGTANIPEGTFTINKPSGTVTLTTNVLLDGTGQDLVISSGTLDMSTFNLTVDDVITVSGGLKQGSGNLTASNGNMTIDSTGWWLNNSTGDFVMDGGDTLTNNGYVRLDGTSVGCGDADAIALTRSGAGSVNLAGSGRWRVFDVDFSNYAASPALTVYSSTNTTGNTGITFTGTCPSERTWIGSGNYNSGANWTGSTVPGTTELAVFDATSTSNMTVDADPNDNGFQINLGYTGTITQTNGIDITLDDQGWDQNSGTFTGGDATSDMTLANGGDFTLSNGTFTAPAGNTTLVDNVTFSGGTFNHGSGTILFYAVTDGSSTITGSFTFYDAMFINDNQFSTQTYTIQAGTTLTGAVGGTLTYYAEGDGATCVVNGSGSIVTAGNVETSTRGCRGSVETTFNGTGAQTLSQTGTGDTYLPSIEIDKSSGTLTISGTLWATDNWTYTQGIIDPGTSTVVFSAHQDDTGAITGSHSLNNIRFEGTGQFTTNTHTISSGTTLTALGTLQCVTDGDASTQTINGPGVIATEGNFTTVHNNAGSGSCNGTVGITFGGTAAQNITVGANGLPDGTMTINKSTGTVTLATNLLLDASGQDLVISSGTLDMSTFALTVDDVITVNGGLKQGSGNLTASNGDMTIGSTGWWLNNSTGDFVMDGGDTITNNGYIRLDGTAAGCGDTDAIAMTRSGAGSVNLAGSGRWRVFDVDFSNYAASPALTVYSSTSTTGNSGITFTGTCPSERTWIGSGNYNTGANWTGTSVPGTTELAVFDATSTNNMTVDANPNDNGFQINLGYSGTITQTNGIDITLDDQGWEQNTGTFTGGDATSDMTLANGGDFTLSNGTFTAPAGNTTFVDNVTFSGGTFTHNSGSVILNASGDGTATLTGSPTFNNFTFARTGGSSYTATLASGPFIVNGTLTCAGDPGGGHSTQLTGTGITSLGNITLTGGGCNGNATITISGTGNQTLTGEADTGTFLPQVTINRTSEPGGTTLSLVSGITIENNWTYLAGTISPGTSTVIFRPSKDSIVDNNTMTVSGSHTLGDVTFYRSASEDSQAPTFVIDSGTTLTSTGSMTCENSGAGGSNSTINGPGTLNPQGDFTINGIGCTSGSVLVDFTGSSTQNVNMTNSATSPPNGNWTVNKSSGTVTLASNLDLNGSGQNITITSGTFSNSSYNLTVNDTITVTNRGRLNHGTGNVTAGTFEVGTGGIWENLSTGDVIIGSGGVVNNGQISFGDLHTCGEADDISITSSSGGQQRSWSGSGGFEMYDVSVQDQGGSASIIAFSSTSVSNNDTNWTFNDTCPTAPPGTRIRGGGVRLRGGTLIP